jgi:SEC-C motif-containing protein
MRSRYEAYVRGDVEHLLATWHARTRPDADSLAAEPGTRWLGLEVKRAVEEGDSAVVEFVARFKVGGRPAVRLHEVSRFVREGGCWFYVDGDMR